MHSTERVLTLVNFPYLYKVYSSDIILVFNREYTFTKQFTLKTTFLSRKVFLYFFKQMSSTEIVTCQQVEIYTKNRPNIYIYIYIFKPWNNPDTSTLSGHLQRWYFSSRVTKAPQLSCTITQVNTGYTECFLKGSSGWVLPASIFFNEFQELHLISHCQPA